MRALQRGIGMIGILFVLVLAAFIVTVALRLGPMYLNFWTLKSIMDNVASSPEAAEEGKRGVTDLIFRRIDVNSARHVTPKDFKFEKRSDGTLDVTLHYEQRQHLFGNIDVVLTFDHAVAIPSR